MLTTRWRRRSSIYPGPGACGKAAVRIRSMTIRTHEKGRRHVCDAVPCQVRELGTSESVDLLGQCRLAVGGLVRVDDALGNSLVQATVRDHEFGLRGGLVARGGSGLDPADGGLECRLHGLVAQASLLVGANALDLGLDVGHA